MAEEIDFENGRNSNFEGLVTLTLTFDPATQHIVLQQSSTSTYIPNFIQIEETFCGRTDVRTGGRTDIFPLYIIRSTFGSRPKKDFQCEPWVKINTDRGTFYSSSLALYTSLSSQLAAAPQRDAPEHKQPATR